MRYLLDELMSYEEDFSDILMSHRTKERHDTFMGIPDPSSTVRQADLQILEANIIAKLEGLIPQTL
ncbi:hypothetical protein H0H81_000520, partial [Sphagnurus paluster]